MNLKEKTIAALEKQVGLLLQDGVPGSQVETACKSVEILTGLLAVIQNI